MIENLIEFLHNRGGLTIAAGKRKRPKSLENQGLWAMVWVFITDLAFAAETRGFDNVRCPSAVPPIISSRPAACPCPWDCGHGSPQSGGKDRAPPGSRSVCGCASPDAGSGTVAFWQQAHIVLLIHRGFPRNGTIKLYISHIALAIAVGV